MPLQLPSPPPNAYTLLTLAISQLSVAGGPATQAIKFTDPTKLNSALPHKVYMLGSSEIAQGRNLNQALLVAWRFLIQYGSRTVGAVELSCNAVGANLRFASFDVGPFAQGTRNIVSQAETLDSVRRGSYELRLLKAPSVYVMAVWLKNLGSGDDIVLPIPQTLPPAGSTLGSGLLPLPSSPRDFVKSLQPSARTALGFDSRPQSPTPQSPAPQPLAPQGGAGGRAPVGTNRPR
jgi:hypothetical protein